MCSKAASLARNMDAVLSSFLLYHFVRLWLSFFNSRSVSDVQLRRSRNRSVSWLETSSKEVATTTSIKKSRKYDSVIPDGTCQ